MFTLQRQSKKGSARRQIDIRGVKDGVLMLPRNDYRVVLEASSVNFELKSEQEQDALIDTYESFLNSLPCPIQILVRIRELDMDKYLSDLRLRLSVEHDEVYRAQIEAYEEFVRGLVSNNKILSRRFYVVIPFSGKDGEFEAAQEQLALRADIVRKGLMRLGMRARRLSSLEILELFQSFYNPAQAKRQPISESVVRLLNGSYVRRDRG